MNENEFDNLKKQGKIFPIFISINADEITAVSIYYKLKGDNKFLLESSSKKNGEGRYSFIGSEPYMILQGNRNEITTISKGKIVHENGRILDYAQEYLNFSYADCGLNVPFAGGAVGYVGYDVIRQYELLPDENKDEINVPEACLMFYKKYICMDHLKNTAYLIYNVYPEDKRELTSIFEELRELENSLKQESNIHEISEASSQKAFSSDIDKTVYCSMVEKAKSYIRKGDIFQVVLSRRFKYKSTSEPFDIYRRLRRKNPSPYMFFMDFGCFQIVGSSPESLVTLQDGIVSTNPIAGTKPRGKDDKEDNKLQEELMNDEKERAEHVMLVDLGRNDIGKVSEIGSVKVDRFMDIELYSHVMHIVSNVSGRLKGNLNCFDALIACLPVGTVSGAPKIRAMEIIDQLENVRRGIYSGAVGYFSINGNMNTCIAIRTLVIKQESVYVQAGAGIVYDSVPENEFVETINKAKALEEVI